MSGPEVQVLGERLSESQARVLQSLGDGAVLQTYVNPPYDARLIQAGQEVSVESLTVRFLLRRDFIFKTGQVGDMRPHMSQWAYGLTPSGKALAVALKGWKG